MNTARVSQTKGPKKTNDRTATFQFKELKMFTFKPFKKAKVGWGSKKNKYDHYFLGEFEPIFDGAKFVSNKYIYIFILESNKIKLLREIKCLGTTGKKYQEYDVSNKKREEKEKIHKVELEVFRKSMFIKYAILLSQFRIHNDYIDLIENSPANSASHANFIIFDCSNLITSPFHSIQFSETLEPYTIYMTDYIELFRNYSKRMNIYNKYYEDWKEKFEDTSNKNLLYLNTIIDGLCKQKYSYKSFLEDFDHKRFTYDKQSIYVNNESLKNECLSYLQLKVSSIFTLNYTREVAHLKFEPTHECSQYIWKKRYEISERFNFRRFYIWAKACISLLKSDEFIGCSYSFLFGSHNKDSKKTQYLLSEIDKNLHGKKGFDEEEGTSILHDILIPVIDLVFTKEYPFEHHLSKDLIDFYQLFHIIRNSTKTFSNIRNKSFQAYANKLEFSEDEKKKSYFGLPFKVLLTLVFAGRKSGVVVFSSIGLMNKIMINKLSQEIHLLRNNNFKVIGRINDEINALTKKIDSSKSNLEYLENLYKKSQTRLITLKKEWDDAIKPYNDLTDTDIAKKVKKAKLDSLMQNLITRRKLELIDLISIELKKQGISTNLKLADCEITQGGDLKKVRIYRKNKYIDIFPNMKGKVTVQTRSRKTHKLLKNNTKKKNIVDKVQVIQNIPTKMNKSKWRRSLRELDAKASEEYSKEMKKVKKTSNYTSNYRKNIFEYEQNNLNQLQKDIYKNKEELLYLQQNKKWYQKNLMNQKSGHLNNVNNLINKAKNKIKISSTVKYGFNIGVLSFEALNIFFAVDEFRLKMNHEMLTDADYMNLGSAFIDFTECLLDFRGLIISQINKGNLFVKQKILRKTFTLAFRNFARYLPIINILSCTFDLFIYGNKSYDQLKEGDVECSTAYDIAALGACLTLIGTSLSATGVGCVILVIGIILQVGANVYTAVFDKSALEIWLEHCYWGEDFGDTLPDETEWVVGDFYNFTEKPDIKRHRAFGNIYHQILSFHKIMYNFELTPRVFTFYHTYYTYSDPGYDKLFKKTNHLINQEKKQKYYSNKHFKEGYRIYDSERIFPIIQLPIIPGQLTKKSRFLISIWIADARLKRTKFLLEDVVFEEVQEQLEIIKGKKVFNVSFVDKRYTKEMLHYPTFTKNSDETPLSIYDFYNIKKNTEIPIKGLEEALYNPFSSSKLVIKIQLQMFGDSSMSIPEIPRYYIYKLSNLGYGVPVNGIKEMSDTHYNHPENIIDYYGRIPVD